MNDQWTLVACGCGTANYWIVRLLVRSVLAKSLARVVLCDRGRIRKNNAITCPSYMEIDRPKSEMLEELARRWLGGKAVVEAIHGTVEQLQWDDILPLGAAPGHRTVVLDGWPSRLAVTEDLRCRSASLLADVVMVQVGLDRGQASVAVFGCRFEDPCPACGLRTLPESEPCVVLTAGNKTLRGNLHREAQAAARLVRKILSDHLGGRSAGWINTKTNLVTAGLDGERYCRFTRSCRQVAGCLGPHAPTMSLRWDKILAPVNMDCAM
jgi:hypothetical protein